MYEEELPIEEYIYSEALKERHEDSQRFKELIALNDASDEDAATELLYVSKRLFYNFYGLDKVMDARNTILHFFDVDTDDDTIPSTMNCGLDEHNELIEDVLNALDDVDDLKKLNPKKMANRFPELPFLTLMKIVLMEIQEETPNKILKQLDDALSIYPDDILLKLEQESALSREGKKGKFISDEFVHSTTASGLFKRKVIHSFELMSLHAALFEYLVSKKDILLLDALMFASQTLYPEWEDAWSDKEVYSEILKVEFCQLNVNIG
ncbi:hypothetical protein J1N10_15365 [Carboxylicivirga sp. A043]|uniref:hypothetical protein n=1 Tax=Carboxylicivirga litoralis TaxID=2816963 RepID=UPI0021CB74C5|nr:hypothetical protein [Carboxylicivirga sp. A043]MCU4157354.1 hypothetical protein [Carboxylicivirga sp. A043]